MFSTLLESLSSDIATLKAVRRMNDNIRRELDAIAVAQSILPEPWLSVFAAVPNRIDWQRYDHCAAFTRLYALFETFVDEVIKHHLTILPQVVKKYEDLSDAMKGHHRVAIGQILQKWSDKSPHKHLSERQIVECLAGGFSNAPYHLLAEAFLLETSNYRADTINKLFAPFGIPNCIAGVALYSKMQHFMSNNRDANESPATVLQDIVEHRNSASHGSPGTLVGLNDFESFADFVLVLADCLIDALKKALLPLLATAGLLEQRATVIADWGSPKGIALRPGILSKNDFLIRCRGDELVFGFVESIELNNVPYDSVNIASATDYAIKFSIPLKVGDELFKSTLVLT